MSPVEARSDESESRQGSGATLDAFAPQKPIELSRSQEIAFGLFLACGPTDWSRH